ncbi:MAG: hypothetical protein ABFD64_13960 [Armatimonadota bacterium]
MNRYIILRLGGFIVFASYIGFEIFGLLIGYKAISSAPSLTPWIAGSLLGSFSAGGGIERLISYHSTSSSWHTDHVVRGALYAVPMALAVEGIFVSWFLPVSLVLFSGLIFQAILRLVVCRSRRSANGSAAGGSIEE